jgi:hypothetical protein
MDNRGVRIAYIIYNYIFNIAATELDPHIFRMSLQSNSETSAYTRIAIAHMEKSDSFC